MLPEELLLKIFSFLNPEDFDMLAVTRKRFYEIINGAVKIWNKAHMKYFEF